MSIQRLREIKIPSEKYILRGNSFYKEKFCFLIMEFRKGILLEKRLTPDQEKF